MKKIIDKKIMKALIIISVIGIVFGSIFFIITTKGDKLLIKEELNDYINLFKLNKVSINLVLSSIKTNYLLLSLIFIFQIVYILSPLIIFINFYKGMQIGFLTSSLIYTYKAKSIGYILILMPKELLILAVFIIYSSIMLKYSKELFILTKENKSLDIKLYIKRITIIYIGALLLVLFLSLIGLFLSKLLINTII